MSVWDVFHSDRLEVERGLTTAQVRAALGNGDLRDDDLVRPAGAEIGWARLSDFPEFFEPEPPVAPTTPAATGPAQDLEPQASPSPASPRSIDDEGSFETQAGAFPPVPSDDVAETIAEPSLEAQARATPPLEMDDFSPPSFDDVESDVEALTQFNANFDETRSHPFLDSVDDEDRATYLAAPGDEDHERVANDTYLDALGEARDASSVDNEEEDEIVDLGELDLSLDHERRDISLELEPVGDEDVEPWVDDAADAEPWEEEYDPQDEDEEAAEFTLARGSAETVEELDLAAMVDVAFQLVLFFLVTATTVLYKTLEVPKPNPEAAAASATQGQGKTLDDLQQDFILVDIDPQGAFKIDREPVAAQMNVLIDRLRTARQSTGRSAMLLTADAAAMHKHAVLAYDAANEIGLRIAIARPASVGGGAAAPPAPAVSKKGNSG